MKEKNQINSKKYIILIRYVTNEQAGGAWEGKIKMITREIKNIGINTEARFKSMQALIEDLNTQMMNQFDSKMTNQLAEIKTLIEGKK